MHPAECDYRFIHTHTHENTHTQVESKEKSVSQNCVCVMGDSPVLITSCVGQHQPPALLNGKRCQNWSFTYKWLRQQIVIEHWLTPKTQSRWERFLSAGKQRFTNTRLGSKGLQGRPLWNVTLPEVDSPNCKHLRGLVICHQATLARWQRWPKRRLLESELCQSQDAVESNFTYAEYVLS